MAIPDKPKADRAYISGVTLSIGMLSTNGNLHVITKPNVNKSEAVHRLCPECTAPTQFASQRYVCNDDPSHGPFAYSDTAVGKEIDGTIVILDADKVAEARQSVLPAKELALQVHRRADVERHTFAKGNAYVFMPTGSSPLYGILLEILKKRRDLALVAKTNMRKTDHIIMVDVEMNDQLVVREMMWPEDMKEFPTIEREPASEKLLGQAEMLMDASVEDFIPDEYRKDSRERIAALVEEASGATPTTAAKAAKPKATKEDDLSALIEAAIAEKQRKQVS